ncbi:MAG: sulfatase [Deltaproteobacteria bacterium]|nr:sulfatase [Deltaproteobacteria bacterium]
MGGASQTRGRRILRSLPELAVRGLAATLLVAAMEALLVQWTSHAVPPGLLAIDFAVTAAVLAMLVVPSAALLASGGAVFFRSVAPGELSFGLALVSSLGFYDASRIRTEKLSLQDPACLFPVAILGIGAWLLLRPSARRAVPENGESEPARGASAGASAHLLVAATAATWAALHVRGRFTPTIVVLALFGAFTALQVACGRWRFTGHRSALARRSALGEAVAALAQPFVAYAAFASASYPLVPGILRPQRLERQAPQPGGSEGLLPNVIVVIMDTVRADHLSAYGYQIPTSPRLSEFAERAYLFRNAVANSNWSFPSHATLLTGLLPHQPGAYPITTSSASPRGLTGGAEAPVTAQPLLERRTIAGRLQEHGYETGLVAANYAWLSSESGFTEGFDYVDNRPRSLPGWEPFCGAYLRHQPIEALQNAYARSSATTHPAHVVVRHGMDFLRVARHPFFLFLNFMDAHRYYASPLGARAAPEIQRRLREARWSATNLEMYDRNIAFLDHQLGLFLRELEARGLFDDALIVITSDHGQKFGPSGPGWHGRDLSQDSIHVPLLVKMPHQRSGETVVRVAQLADVAPTILEAVGLQAPEEFFGSSLARRSRAVIAESYGTLVPMNEIPSRAPIEWAMFDGDWKLLRTAGGRDLLYNLTDDPLESDDLAARRPEVARQLGDRLAALVPRRSLTDRAPGARPEVSSLTLEKLKSLGYAQ